LGLGRRSGRGAPRVRSISNTRPLVAPQRTAVECQQPTNAAQQNYSLFYHRVGEREQPIWHIQTEQVRGIKVDYQFELCRLLDR
jgi:hypothetical protein